MMIGWLECNEETEDGRHRWRAGDGFVNRAVGWKDTNHRRNGGRRKPGMTRVYGKIWYGGVRRKEGYYEYRQAR